MARCFVRRRFQSFNDFRCFFVISNDFRFKINSFFITGWQDVSSDDDFSHSMIFDVHVLDSESDEEEEDVFDESQAESY